MDIEMNIRQNQRILMNLKGKVKSIREIIYQPNVGQKEIRAIGEKIDPNGLDATEYILNENGNMIEYKRNSYGEKCHVFYTHFNKENKVEKIINTSDNSDPKKVVLHYNKKGLLARSIWFDTELRFMFSYEYSFNHRDDQTQYKTIINDGEESLIEYDYKYNHQGNIIQKTRCMDDKLHLDTFYNYDKKGNRIGLKVFDVDGNLIGKVSKNYDDNRNIIQNKNFDFAHNSLSIEKYDEDGNTTEQSQYKYDGGQITGVVRQWYYQYEFDKAGNWIRKTQIIDGAEWNVFTREIEYFE